MLDKERINQSSGYNLRQGFPVIGFENNIWDEWKDMNVVEYFSRHKGMEEGTKTKKTGGELTMNLLSIIQPEQVQQILKV